MDDQSNEALNEQVGVLLERHGDEAADELVKTIRTTRRLTLAVFAIVGIMFVVIAGIVIWAIANGGPSADPSSVFP